MGEGVFIPLRPPNSYNDEKDLGGDRATGGDRYPVGDRAPSDDKNEVHGISHEGVYQHYVT